MRRSTLDNVTHSLMGAALAEVALLGHPEPGRAARLRPAAWLVSILASNVPDVDILYAHSLGGQLGYLLHHRGHTHTLVAILPMALLALGAGWLLRRRALPGDASRGDRARLVALALLGPLVHLWMDGWNHYGVHPFWPFDPSWTYGDRVFVLEPWIWVLLMPALMGTPPLRGRGRWFLLTLFLLILLAGLLTGVVPRWILLALLLMFGASWVGAARLGIRAVPLTLVALLAVVTGMGWLSGRAKAAVRARLPAPAHDVVASPLPADPGCWQVLSVEADEVADRFRIRRGAWSATGAGAGDCARRAAGVPSAPLESPELPSDGELVWTGRFEARLSELRRLARDHCRFAAFLGFARTPTWQARPDGSWYYGDLRFDRNARLGFAELIDPLGPEDACEDVVVPGWTPPVASLLEPPK